MTIEKGGKCSSRGRVIACNWPSDPSASYTAVGGNGSRDTVSGCVAGHGIVLVNITNEISLISLFLIGFLKKNSIFSGC